MHHHRLQANQLRFEFEWQKRNKIFNAKQQKIQESLREIIAIAITILSHNEDIFSRILLFLFHVYNSNRQENSYAF